MTTVYYIVIFISFVGYTPCPVFAWVSLLMTIGYSQDGLYGPYGPYGPGLPFDKCDLDMALPSLSQCFCDLQLKYCVFQPKNSFLPMICFMSGH